MKLVDSKVKGNMADLGTKISMVAGSQVQSQFNELIGEDADLQQVQEAAFLLSRRTNTPILAATAL